MSRLSRPEMIKRISEMSDTELQNLIDTTEEKYQFAKSHLDNGEKITQTFERTQFDGLYRILNIDLIKMFEQSKEVLELANDEKKRRTRKE